MQGSFCRWLMPFILTSVMGFVPRSSYIFRAILKASRTNEDASGVTWFARPVIGFFGGGGAIKGAFVLSAIAILRQLRWLHVQVRVFWRYATIRLQEMAVAYAPPCLHLIACAIIGLGYFVRPWQWLLGGMEYLIVADFPVSFLGVGLAWSHQVLALTWFVVAGTLWWYLLARLAGIRGRTNKTASGERQCGSISDKGTIALIGSVFGEQKAQSCRSLYSRICHSPLRFPPTAAAALSAAPDSGHQLFPDSCSARCTHAAAHRKTSPARVPCSPARFVRAPARLVLGLWSGRPALLRCGVSQETAAADRSGPDEPTSAHPSDRLCAGSPRSTERSAHAPQSLRAPTHSAAGLPTASASPFPKRFGSAAFPPTPLSWPSASCSPSFPEALHPFHSARCTSLIDRPDPDRS